jgi:hypothetical protein
MRTHCSILAPLELLLAESTDEGRANLLPPRSPSPTSLSLLQLARSTSPMDLQAY